MKPTGTTSHITTQSRLQESIVARIEAEDITPRSKWLFLGREFIVWFLWALSVCLGVFAVSVSLYVLIHTQYAFYEATHENFLTFMVDFLPLAWLMVFALMTIFAYYNFRHTRGGYRYPMSKIFFSSLLFSIVGGVVLHAAGMGYLLERELEKWVPIYHSMESRERALWQQPQDGRLLGHLLSGEVGSSSAITFIDVDGMTWVMITEDLFEPDLRLLTSKKMVRVIGFADQSQQFHPCGVFPWLHSASATIKDMARERTAFVERMYAHKAVKKQAAELQADDTRYTLGGSTEQQASYVSSTTVAIAPCRELTVIKRIEAAR